MDTKQNISIEQRVVVVVNGRFRTQQITGVQRYAHEITSRISILGEIFSPKSVKGVAGHLWEQTSLPLLCHGRLLWSPNASGPLNYRNQVVTFHDLFPVEHPEWYSSAYSLWYGISMRKLARQSKHLITVSHYTKSRLEKIFSINPERISVIHNGCHIRGPASKEQIEEAAKELHLPTRKYVLSLSSMERRKNTAAILEAWGSIYDRVPNDVWLVLAGPPADISVYGRQLENARHPRVLFTGYVPEKHLVGLYTGSLLFAFPSFAEGFGFPLLEAMACGVRCITSDTTSLREIGGDLVDYIDPSQSAELANMIYARVRQATAIDTPFEGGIERARSFSWDTAAYKTELILQAAYIQERQLQTVGGTSAHEHSN